MLVRILVAAYLFSIPPQRWRLQLADYDFSMLCLMLYIVEAATLLDQKASYFLLSSSKRMSCRCQKVITVIRKAMSQPVILCQPGVLVVHLKYWCACMTYLWRGGGMFVKLDCLFSLRVVDRNLTAFAQSGILIYFWWLLPLKFISFHQILLVRPSYRINCIRHWQQKQHHD